MRQAVVYWIHLPNETDIAVEGYVGVSCQFAQRLNAHKTGYGNKNVRKHFAESVGDVVVEVVFEGIEDECYAFELSLRPTRMIGWNVAEGGFKPPSPLGEFDSITEAAVAHGAQHSTIHARIKYYKTEGYEYVE